MPDDALTDASVQDRSRWAALAIAILAAFIVVLDNTVLNVAIPTIVRDLDTTLPSIEWVVTGYALTFATFLIIGGRLGDVYGHRRIFIIGAGFFGVGSLMAALSQSVAHLIVGEAIIEGIGASMMLPATLAILSGTFRGKERATAFAAWGATAGVAAAVGPVVGGFLTTNFSWRWSFGINVVIAPLTIIGALVFMAKAPSGARKKVSIDVPGAVLVAVGMFLIVFALSEGGRYGWWEPLDDFSLAGTVLWPASRPVSMVVPMILVGVTVLVGFTFFERKLERTGKDPLFEFKHLSLKTYRYGLLTGLVIGMGQLGLSFVLPVFLQSAKHLSAQRNGLWLLPTGVFVIIGAQVGGRLIRVVNITTVVRIGLVSYAFGILLIVRAASVDITAWTLLPGLACYGVGIGFAGAQLTNVVLSDIPPESSGVASGANTTVRQVGMALGVAVIGTLLTSRTISQAVSRIDSASLPASVKAEALAAVRDQGTAYRPRAGLAAGDGATLRHALEQSVVSGTRTALVFAGVLVALGAAVSLLIPKVKPPADVPGSGADGFEPLEPLDPDPKLRQDDAPQPA